MAPGDTLPEHQVHSQVHASCTTAQPVSAEIVAAAGETPRAELAALKMQ